MALEVGNATRVIVVDVGRDDGVDRGDAKPLGELVEVVRDEAEALERELVGAYVQVRAERVAIVDQQRLASAAEQHVEVRARPRTAPQEVLREPEQARFGQRVRRGRGRPRVERAESEADDIDQPLLQAVDVAGDVLHRGTMRGQDERRVVAAQRLEGFDRE